MSFMKGIFMGEIGMMCREMMMMKKDDEDEEEDEEEALLPEVHNPPSSFGGEKLADERAQDAGAEGIGSCRCLKIAETSGRGRDRDEGLSVRRSEKYRR